MPQRLFFLLLAALFAGACQREPLPKPAGMLRLEYLPAVYQYTENNGCYEFQRNNLALPVKKKAASMELVYPAMKATLYLTYKKVERNIDKLLADAQKRTYQHTLKADAITEQPYLNQERRVYGMLYQVAGNAASHYQFYVTDSLEHFLTGALYFYAKPNYDSVYPAALYLEKDIRRIMETLRWKYP